MAFPTNPIYKFIEHKESYIASDGSSHTTTDTLVRKYCGGDLYLDIPFIEKNSDYQEYLAWKSIDGNEPEAAD